ncbi:unnamed protein product [Victoria cruziana]
MEKKGRPDSDCPVALADQYDVLVEVLKRLDARSLGVAACVCRQWRDICTQESVWEHLCNRHVSAAADVSAAEMSQIRSVIVAMGGYRRLYLMCIRPLLERLPPPEGGPGAGTAACTWTRDQVQLSLSLFSIDCYERLGSELGDSTSSSSLSLRFLCKPRFDSAGICCSGPNRS